MTLLPEGSEVPYTITWLEMKARPSFPRPPAPTGKPAALLRAEDPPVWYFLSLYGAVGRDYAWEDMFTEPEETLATWLHHPKTALYTLMREGWPHGFFLLDHSSGATCNLAYFGLVPQAVGSGLGRFLLHSAIHTGWDMPGVERLTVNTCDLDHPRALGLYQQAGFAPVRRSNHVRVLQRPLKVQL